MSSFCSGCGTKLAGSFCSICGASADESPASVAVATAIAADSSFQPYNIASRTNRQASMPNVPILDCTLAHDSFAEGSGQRTGRKNPAFSGKWNWGAFFFQWLWLMFHGYVGLGFLFLVVSFVPFANLCVPFYFGMKGNDLAYNQRRFTNIEQYIAVQNAWRNWGFGFAGVGLCLGVVAAAAGH
jgi:hypothetical protein